MEAVLETVLKRGTFEFGEIRKVLEFLKTIDLKKITLKLPNQSEIKADEINENLNSLFATLIDHESDLDNLEINLRLEMAGDSLFSRLLWVLRDKVFIEFLRPLISKKMNCLNPEALHTLWIWIKQESGFEEDKIIRVSREDVSETFYEIDDDEKIKENIVEYLINIKPSVIRRRLLEGHEMAIPIKIPGLSKILTWTDVGSARQNSAQEDLLITSLGKIIYFWNEYINEDTSTLRSLLSINVKDKRIFGLDPFEKESLDKNKDEHLKYLFYEMNKIVALAEELASRPIELAAVLDLYKHKLELSKKTLFERIKENHEKEIQNEFRAFLLDRGIYAFGNQFGDKEIDAVVPEGLENLAIEIAIFRNEKENTPSKIQRKFEQLQAYVNEFPQMRKGVLLIYNLSDKRIHPLRSWIGGKYLILAINLGKSPSKTKEIIQITEGGKKHLQFETTPHANKRKRSKNSGQ